MRKESGYHILRVSLGITFAWVGVLIFRDPTFWGGFIQPWALALLPVPIRQVMVGTGVLDVAIGLLLLGDVYTWVVGAVAAAHMALVLVVSGVDEVTVRDIGLLGAGVSLAWTDAPEWLKMKFRKHQQ